MGPYRPNEAQSRSRKSLGVGLEKKVWASSTSIFGFGEMFLTLAYHSVRREECSFLVRSVTVILTATIPSQPLDKHINLHIMVMELCKKCSYLTSDFHRGDLKEPPNYSFTCQLKTTSPLDLLRALVVEQRELMRG